MVVRPADTEEVAEIMKTAFNHNIPVTPRAGASTVYFDSVPIKDGIVMDLNLIKGVVGVDEAGMTVTVKAGTTWSELDEYLNRRGLAPKSFPSSAPAASIGGWFCMMGYGIGSMKYGSLLSQVRSMRWFHRREKSAGLPGIPSRLWTGLWHPKEPWGLLPSWK